MAYVKMMKTRRRPLAEDRERTIDRRVSKPTPIRVDRHRLRRASGAAVIAAIGAMAFGAVTAAAANVPAGNLWITFGSWNRPSGMGVGVGRAVDNVSSGPFGGDWGDNVIHPRMRVGEWSTTMHLSLQSASTSAVSVRHCLALRGGIYAVSTLNMSCSSAFRLIGRVSYIGPSGRIARLKGWWCKTIGAYPEGATFRCRRRTSAFLWTAGG